MYLALLDLLLVTVALGGLAFHIFGHRHHQ